MSAADRRDARRRNPRPLDDPWDVPRPLIDWSEPSDPAIWDKPAPLRQAHRAGDWEDNPINWGLVAFYAGAAAFAIGFWLLVGTLLLILAG